MALFVRLFVSADIFGRFDIRSLTDESRMELMITDKKAY